GALEKVVSDRVMRVVLAMQVRIDRQRSSVVVELRQPRGVAPARIPVLSSTVDLVLLLIKPMHDVSRAATWKIRWTRQQPIRRGDAWLRTRPCRRWQVRLD